MTSATEELRRMLDERGARWWEEDGHTLWYGESIHHAASAFSSFLFGENERVHLNAMVTPEQAVEATLGSRNCSNSERTGTCRLEGFADVPFSVDYEIDGYDMGSSRDYATLAECSSCGAYVILPPEYHHVLTCDGDEVYQPYRFCPNCGRRIEVDA